MKTLRMLDSSGDTSIEFDEADPVAKDKARVVFNAWMKKKLPAFQIKPGQPDKKVADFDAIEEGAEVILVPGIVAG